MRCTVSWNLLATVYWSRDEVGVGWSKFLQEFALQASGYVWLRIAAYGRLHLVRDTAAEKRVWYCNINDTEHVSSEIQENRNGRVRMS